MKKVLITEDHDLIANVYRERFQKNGFDVVVAPDGESAIQAVKTKKPDLVLLDLMLPKINGIEVLKFIRSNPESKSIPVIVFTNTYLKAMVDEAQKLGATKFLAKAENTPNQVIQLARTALGLTVDGAKETQIAASQSCLEAVPNAVIEMQHLNQIIQKNPRNNTALAELYGKVHAFTGKISLINASQLARMAAAFEALLKELMEKPDQINPSTLHVVTQAIDCLCAFCRTESVFGDDHSPPIHIFAVDDDKLSLYALSRALDIAHLRAEVTQDPIAALTVLEEKNFDLIFLDVQMPSMDGFELCKQLRSLPRHKKTPVVFLTAHSNLQNVSQSILSGGNDFIEKPYLFSEIALKSLLYALRRRPAKKN